MHSSFYGKNDQNFPSNGQNLPSLDPSFSSLQDRAAPSEGFSAFSVSSPEQTLFAAKNCYNRTGFALCAMLLVHAVLPSLIIFLLSLFEITLPMWASYAVSAFSLYGAAIPLFYLLIKKEPPTVPAAHPVSASDLVAALLISFPLLYLGNYLGQFQNFLFSFFTGNGELSPVVDATTELGIGFTFLFVVLLAPFFEELVFRKILLDRVGKYGYGPAIALSGLAFGFFHGNFLQFFYAMFIGFFFAFLYLRTGKVRYTVFLHMLINFFGSIVPMLLTKWTGTEELLAEGAVPQTDLVVPMGVLLILLLYEIWILSLNIGGVALLIVNRKKFTLPSLPGQIETGKEQKLLLSPGMLLFFAFCVLFFLLFLL